MFISPAEMYKTRLNLVHQMHDYIMNMGDETFTEYWNLYGIPDCPDEEDFEIYAGDGDNFRELCETFGFLVQRAERRF